VIRSNWKIAIHIRDNYTCQHCGAKEDPSNLTFQVHHIVFKCKGGSSDPDNLLLACPFCHKHFYHSDGYPKGNRHRVSRRKKGKRNRRRR
jgi:5-methylcytosine-specific restriction endonuclease McrA